MKRYETLFIVQIDLPEEELSSLIERYGAIVSNYKGTIIKIEKWGKRKLAYEIKKQTNGYYVLIDYVGKSSIIEEMERNFKIDDKILKFMTILKDDNADPAKLEKEKQEATKTDAQQIVSKSESRDTTVETLDTDTSKDMTSSLSSEK